MANLGNIWENPKKVAEIILRNESLLRILEDSKQRIASREIAERKQIEQVPVGKLWEQQERDQISEQIRDVDPELADKIKVTRNKNELLNLIDNQITAKKKEMDEIQDNIMKILRKERKTVMRGGGVADELLKKIFELKQLFAAEHAKFDENDQLKRQLQDAIKNKLINAQNIDQYIQIAEKLKKNAEENVSIQARIDEILASLKRLQAAGKAAMIEFEAEVGEIEAAKKK